MRILYLAGLGQIHSTFEAWKAGKRFASDMRIPHSIEFLEACRKKGAHGFLLGWGSPAVRVEDEEFRIEHRPIRLRRTGVLYHLAWLYNALDIVVTAIRYRADVVVSSNFTFMWVLGLLRFFGIRIVPSLHNRLYSERGDSLTDRLHRPFLRWFLKTSRAVLCTSSVVGDDVRRLCGRSTPPILEFLPTYDRTTFAGLGPQRNPPPPMRVLYIGRIRREKGVFDIVEMCRSLRSRGLDVEFDICGVGPALDRLLEVVRSSEVSDHVRCHGHCNQARIRELFGESHALIAPTRKSFGEGFAMVVAEGVLANRPVITSRQCPGMLYVLPAVAEVPCEDVEAYEKAIERLYGDRLHRDSLVRACAPLHEQFFDPERSWQRALEIVIDCTRRGARPPAISWLPAPSGSGGRGGSREADPV